MLNGAAIAENSSSTVSCNSIIHPPPRMETRTLPGSAFLKLLLQHILPKGFGRARNFGFLHHNSKLVKRVQWIKKVFVPPPQPRPTVACPCCGNPLRLRMLILTRVRRMRSGLPQQGQATVGAVVGEGRTLF